MVRNTLSVIHWILQNALQLAKSSIVQTKNAQIYLQAKSWAQIIDTSGWVRQWLPNTCQYKEIQLLYLTWFGVKLWPHNSPPTTPILGHLDWRIESSVNINCLDVLNVAPSLPNSPIRLSCTPLLNLAPFDHKAQRGRQMTGIYWIGRLCSSIGGPKTRNSPSSTLM